jgi:tRNA(Ile)-lysidine synthase TilS/MesJ
MKICSQCVLTETMPHITFDSKGICNFCRQSKKIELKGEAKLLELLDSYRSSEKKYECIVSLSGGRDSSYTLLKMAKDYNMKVLAVNYANPFTDPVAQKNIENAVKRLNVDLVQVHLKKNLHEKTFRYNFNVWMTDPNPALIPMLCIACKTYYYNILKIAKKEGIHCIVNGGNPYEDTSFKKELLNVASDEKIENSFIKAISGNPEKSCILSSGFYSDVD